MVENGTGKPDKQVVIFDLDGTLLQTLPSITVSSNAMLKYFGLPSVDMDLVARFIGNGSRILVERLMRHAGREEPLIVEEALKVYLDVFEIHCTDGVEPFDGVPEMLRDLRSMGADLAVVTNKNASMTARVLSAAFAPDLFSDIRGYTPSFPLKPDPSLTIDVLQNLQALPGCSFFVGDSDIDVFTGKNAGTRTIAVTWGYQPIERLRDANPDYIADKPEEVVGFICQYL